MRFRAKKQRDLRSNPLSRFAPSRLPVAFSRSLLLAACLLVALAACARGGLSRVDSPVAPSAPAKVAATPVCDACTLDATRYLRQLSFDLRGRPPSFDELAQVAQTHVVTDKTIDAMLASDELVARAREWHRALLWPNLDNFKIHATPIVATELTAAKKRVRRGFSPDPALVGEGASKHPGAVVSLADNNVERLLRGADKVIACDGDLEYPPPASATSGPKSVQPTYAIVGSDKKKRTYPYYDRDGVPLPYHDAEHCPNYCSTKTDGERAAPGFKIDRGMFAAMNAPGADPSPHELDPAGSHCPATHPNRVINVCSNAILPNSPENAFRERRDGYRKVKHYWSGETPIHTCAYEAQERTLSVYNGQACAGQVLRDASCGCGPSGEYCMPSLAKDSALASRAEHLVRSALNEEPLMIVESVIARDEDYFDIFTTRRSFLTGPLAFLYRSQLPSLQGLEIAAPAAPSLLPELSYDDSKWHEYVRGPEHAGVLTTPAWLGRFPTWRSRISQFRTSFMCRPFSPGTASLPSPDDACTREPNLAKRCGCRNCHAAIEPMTAWFGRWAERSAKYLDAASYPAFDPSCQQCALTGQGCTPRCKTQYVVDTVDADGARYAGTLRGYLYRTHDEEARIDEGPAGLVASAIASGELESCTVRNTWKALLGRPMSDAEIAGELPSLVADFDAKHRSYRALVRSIVTSKAYRRID